MWLWAAIGIALAGCGRKPADGSAASPSPTPDDSPAIEIGFIAPMSGAQGSFGNDAIHGATLAVEEINAAGGVLGQRVRLVARDTQSRPDETTIVVEELLKNPTVFGLVGEVASDRSLVAAPLAQQRGMPMITPASTNDAVTETGNFIFRACYTDAYQAAAMAKFAHSIGAKRVAVLADLSTPYSAALARIFKEDFARLGGETVAELPYRAGDRDFATQLGAIKNSAPELIFLPSYYAEAALIIRQARELGIEVPFVGTDGWDSPKFLEVGGSAVNNCYFASHFSADEGGETAVKFVAAYREKFGTAPPPLAALSYDAVRMLADAIVRAGLTDRVAIRDALATTRDFPGVTGSISLDPHRNPAKPVVVLRVQDGAFTYLETVRL